MVYMKHLHGACAKTHNVHILYIFFGSLVFLELFRDNGQLHDFWVRIFGTACILCRIPFQYIKENFKLYKLP